MATGIRNPQTWVRLRRNSLRQLAVTIGNEALRHMAVRSQDGLDGRPVKDLTERISRRLSGQPLSSDLELAFSDLLFAEELFQAILRNDFFRVRMGPRVIEERRGAQHTEVLTSAGLIKDVIGGLRDYIAEYRATHFSLPTPAERIAEVVPEQKRGPVKFEVNDGILRVQHQAAATDGADIQNAEAARQELLNSSGELVLYLDESNYDKRLVAILADIRHRLTIRQDVIQLGIASISCQMVCDQLEDELPGIWGAKLQAFAIGVGMYVSQFPEWVRFSENAAMAEFSPGDVKNLHQAGIELVEGLRAIGSSIDPEVPQTLAFLLEVIRDPRRALKRTVFAAVRSIENLIVVVARSFSGVLGAVVGGAQDGAKLAAKYVTATALLTLVANVAITVSPAAGRILQTNWMQKAGELIKEGLEDAK